MEVGLGGWDRGFFWLRGGREGGVGMLGGEEGYWQWELSSALCPSLPLLALPTSLEQEHAHPSISHDQVMEPRKPPLVANPPANHQRLTTGRKK